ncbi:hypothetical protein Tco_1420985 [Tanacetum coccineum]
MFLNMDQLEKQLDNEEFQEIRSMAAFKVLETQFQMFINSWIYLDDEYVVMTRHYFLQYTQLEISEFRDTLMQHMESVKKSIDKRALHKREYDSWVNERQMQTTEEKVDTSKALDASLVDTESSRTESEENDTSSRSGNDAHADDADIRPIYDEEPMAKVQTTTEINVFSTRKQHTEQPEFNNEREVNQNAEQCHDTSLKEGQHGHFSKVKSKEAKVKHDIDVIETINIELEHKIAKLLKENKTLKRHYKELSDSIKTTRAKTIELTTSLIAKNDDFKAQLQEKGSAIAALKTIVHHYLPKERESAVAKPHHMIAPGSSRYKRRCCSLIPAESNSLPHAHAQTTKTYYKHQDSRIKKAQVLKTKTSANSDIKDNSSETKLQRRLLESFQEDAKYEHVGQDTRSQGGKDDQDIQGKI